MSVRTSRSCVLFLILASFTTGCGIMASYPTILPNHETGARRPSDESPPSDEPPPREWIGEPTAWWNWSTATGDWNEWRTSFEDKGVEIAGAYVGDFSKVESGGLRRSTATRRTFDLNLTIDLETVLAVPDATVFLDFLTFDGTEGTDLTGSVQPVANLDTRDSAQLSEAWLELWPAPDRVRTKIGKIDVNGEFAFVDHAAPFLSGAFQLTPVADTMPTAPEPAFGGALFAYPIDSIYVGAGVFDGAGQEGVKTGNHGAATLFGNPSDLFVIGEAGITWEPVSGHQGRIGVGGWRHTGTFDKFDGGRRTGSNGGYVVAEQTILPESSEGEGLVAFLLAGLGDEEVNAIERHAGIGVVYRGALPGRNDDVIGLGCTRVEFSDRTGAGFTENSEVLWELFYQAQVTPWLVVQPDLQWIRDPGGDATIGDAWVGSLRVEITL